jgi:hypothetical protein
LIKTYNEEDILRTINSEDFRVKLEIFFNSDSYQESVRLLNEHNAKFRELPDKVKLSVLYMNSSGLDIYLPELWRFMYNIRPPTMEEWLTPEVGGPTVENLYDGWRRVTERDFSNIHNRVLPNEIVLSGCIGSGKTTYLRWILLWVLTRVCCLKNPQATLQVTSETLLVLALFTVTLDKASLALIKPFIKILSDHPWFHQVDKASDFHDFNQYDKKIPYLVRAKYIEFPNNVIINIGSQVEHAISYSMFGALLDEAEFKGSLADTFAVYTNLKERIRSRFLGSPFTMLGLVSSSRYSQGIIADYTKRIKPDDPFTKLYSFAIWEIKNFDAYKNGRYFYVLRGTTAHPHKILDDNEYRLYEDNKYVIPYQCEVIKVPEVYRTDFESRIGEALQNLAGIPVFYTSSYVFSGDLTEIQYPQLCSNIELYVDLGTTEKVIERIPQALFTNAMGIRKFKIAPNALRYLHFDHAVTTEAGVCCLHKELDNNGRVMYVVDFTIKVKANTRIDFTALKDFVVDLSQICHLASVTTDQFQSEMFRQELMLVKVADKIESISVVKSVEPYYSAARLIQNKQVCLGISSDIEKQLASVQADDTKSKDKIFTDGTARRDVVDALVACVWMAQHELGELIEYNIDHWINPVQNEEKKIIHLSGYEEI